MDCSNRLIAAIETGGTKIIGAVYTEDGESLTTITVPTDRPANTLPTLLDFFGQYKISAIGICSFGPLQLDKNSPCYGNITSTPKLGWKNYPLGHTISEALGAPFAMETDVGGALIAEMHEGAGRGFCTCVYATVGTGVGSAFMDNGKLAGSIRHATMGHVILRPHPQDPAPDGFCSFHKGCLEGLASGRAMQSRWGISARELPNDHIAWEIEADYLAQFCVDLILGYMPERIIFGGGVMKKTFIFPLIHRKVRKMIGGYLENPQVNEDIASYIVHATLEGKNGILGAYYIAKKVLEKGGIEHE